MIPAELVLGVFLAIFLVTSIIARRAKVPYTGVLVAIGIGLAAVSSPYLLPLSQAFQGLGQEGLFVALILPPLLFESTLSITTADFRTISRPALVLATGGVVVATLVVGGILVNFTDLPLSSGFLFAALIAPTDVATVLEIFRRTAVPHTLATLLETESIFNDATGVVLLTVILTGLQASTSGVAFVGAVGQFVLISGGGVAVGVAVALGARQLQRETQDTTSQIVLTLTAAYGSYGVASALGVSGLIAVAVTGLFYGNTILFRIEKKEVEQFTRGFWSILAFIANTVAFLFIGVSTNILSLEGSILPILIAYAAVTASRLVSVYPMLSYPVLSKGMPWTWKNTAMLGGMRGALSIALVASLPVTTPGYPVIVNMTFGVAVISILVQGPLMTRYARRAFSGNSTVPEAGPSVVAAKSRLAAGPGGRTAGPCVREPRLS